MKYIDFIEERKIKNLQTTNKEKTYNKKSWLYREYILNKERKKEKTINLVSLFSGIGAFEKALNRIGINTNILFYSEIDKRASKVYSSLYDISEEFNLGNIENINFKNIKNKENIDLVVGGSPCQDFSVAGKRKGSHYLCLNCGENINPLFSHYKDRDRCPKCKSKELEKTKSSLVVEYLRAIRELKPKFFVYENVKGMLFKNFIKGFNAFKKELIDYGYKVEYKVLKGNHYGIPQARERVFLVGIREDIDLKYSFPEEFDSGYRLKDFLLSDDLINEKYFVNATIQKEVIKGYAIEDEGVYACAAPQKKNLRQNGRRIKTKDEPSYTITASDRHGALIVDNIYISKINLDKTNQIIIHSKIKDKKWDKYYDSLKRVYSPQGIAPTVTTCVGGNTEPKTFVSSLRKFTPQENWRLMGFSDKDFFIAKKTLLDSFYNGKDRADSQLYKMAGNSIIVDVLEAIFINMFFA